MYEVRVRAGFAAAHQVRMPTGELEPLHTHEWRVEAVFQGPRLNALGVLVEFISAEESLRAVVEPLRQANLNVLPGLAGAAATTEQVAQYLFGQLRQRLGPDAPLKAVYVWETPDRLAAYWESAQTATDPGYTVAEASS